MAVTYGIDQTSNAVFPNSGARIDTLPLHMDAPTKNKMFYSIRVDLESAGTTTGATFQIQYKLNLASSWTNLKTINASDSTLSTTIPIGRTARRIEFRFNWATSGSNNPLRLRSFTIYYDIVPGNF